MKAWLALALVAVVYPLPACADEADVQYPAYLSAGTLLQYCSANKSDPNQNAKRQACYAYVMGVNDAAVDIYTSRAEPMPYCMPLLQTPGELITIIKPLLEAHRSEKETRAALLVRQRLIEAFPCNV